MRPEGCAPTGLKYRRSAIDQPGVAGGEILQDALDLQLGPAVGVRRAQRMDLVDRQVVRIAVDRGAGREHEAPALRIPQRAEQRERARDVVVEIVERLGDGGADRLQSREMDHRLRREVVHDVPHRRAVADVGARESEIAVRQLLYPRQAFDAGVAQIVDDVRLMARVQSLDERMAADIAGPACYEDAQLSSPSCQAPRSPRAGEADEPGFRDSSSRSPSGLTGSSGTTDSFRTRPSQDCNGKDPDAPRSGRATASGQAGGFNSDPRLFEHIWIALIPDPLARDLAGFPEELLFSVDHACRRTDARSTKARLSD